MNMQHINASEEASAKRAWPRFPTFEEFAVLGVLFLMQNILEIVFPRHPQIDFALGGAIGLVIGRLMWPQKQYWRLVLLVMAVTGLRLLVR